MREIIFAAFTVASLGILIYLSYKSKQRRFPVMYAVTLLCLTAFYLFQYGNLSSFRIKALSTEANFIREKRNEVIQDVKEIEEAKADILAIKKELQQTKDLASPPILRLIDYAFEPLDSGYRFTPQFSPSKNEPLGAIEFTVTVDDNSDARILDFCPSLKGGAFSLNDDSIQIEEDGKRARLLYSSMSVGKPAFALTLSNKANITIKGNYLEKAIVLSPK